jgi:hypothetical protein
MRWEIGSLTPRLACEQQRGLLVAALLAGLCLAAVAAEDKVTTRTRGRMGGMLFTERRPAQVDAAAPGNTASSVKCDKKKGCTTNINLNTQITIQGA